MTLATELLILGVWALAWAMGDGVYDLTNGLDRCQSKLVTMVVLFCLAARQQDAKFLWSFPDVATV